MERRARCVQRQPARLPRRHAGDERDAGIVGGAGQRLRARRHVAGGETRRRETGPPAQPLAHVQRLHESHEARRFQEQIAPRAIERSGNADLRRQLPVVPGDVRQQELARHLHVDLPGDAEEMRQEAAPARPKQRRVNADLPRNDAAQIPGPAVRRRDARGQPLQAVGPERAVAVDAEVERGKRGVLALRHQRFHQAHARLDRHHLAEACLGAADVDGHVTGRAHALSQPANSR